MLYCSSVQAYLDWAGEFEGCVDYNHMQVNDLLLQKYTKMHIKSKREHSHGRLKKSVNLAVKNGGTIPVFGFLSPGATSKSRSG